MLFINWLKKCFGIHVCEEFTRWEEKGCWVITPVWVGGRWEKTKHTLRYQERSCTLCGKIEQRELKLGGIAEEEPSEVDDEETL